MTAPPSVPRASGTTASASPDRVPYRERAARLHEEPLHPAGPRPGFLRGTATSLRDVWSHRELLSMLVRRDIKARYKDSTLGFFWSLMRPLSQLLIYYVALGKFLGAERQITDYAIFVFAGLTAWQLFSEIISSCTGSIVANGGLVKKIYLPREVFPLAAVGSAAFNFLLQVGILLLATVLLGKAPWGLDLLYVPLALLVLLLWATAAGLLLAAVNVYLRDVQYLVEIMLMVLFWTAPTVYSWELVHGVIGFGWLGDLYDANPLTTVVLGFQEAFWVAGDEAAGPGPVWPELLVLAVVGCGLLWLCQRIFTRLQNDFAQEL